jgi:hypothetical protein
MARIDLELKELIDLTTNIRPIWYNISDRRFDLDKVYLVSDGVKQWFGYFKDTGCEDEFEPQCFNRDTDEVINVTIYTEEPELPSE